MEGDLRVPEFAYLQGNKTAETCTTRFVFLDLTMSGVI